MSELKPCPFCGSNNVKIFYGASWMAERYRGNVRSVGCCNCGVNGGIFNLLALGATDETAEKQAIESWNRRADNER